VITRPNATDSMDAALEAAAATPASAGGESSPLVKQLDSNWRKWVARCKQSRLEARHNKVVGKPTHHKLRLLWATALCYTGAFTMKGAVVGGGGLSLGPRPHEARDAIAAYLNQLCR